MSSYDNTDRTAYITLGVIFGSAVGVVAGMLMAPRSGNATREQLRHRALEAKSKAQDQLHTTRDTAMEKMSKALDKSQQAVDKAADKTKETADKVSTRAKEANEQAKADVDNSRGASTRSSSSKSKES